MKLSTTNHLFSLLSLIVLGGAGQLAAQIPVGHELVDDMAVPKGFFLREGVYNRKLWTTKLVHYEFDTPVAASDRVRMRDAMDMLEAVCSIRFLKKVGTVQDWVFIEVSTVANSSWSELGYRGGRQKIGQLPGFSRIGNLHELMHTLSYMHEHQRSDRDTYITVNTANILAGQGTQFSKQSGTIVAPTYDYDSMMHYGAYAFTNGNGPTITSPKPIGNRSHVSYLDAFALRKHYGTPPNPAISSTSPLALPANLPGYQTLTLGGSFFYKPYSGTNNTNRGTEVLFNNVLLTNVTVNSLNSITVQIPANLIQTPGRYPIVIRNPQPGTYAATQSVPHFITVSATASNTDWWGTNRGFGDELEITGDVSNGGAREVLVSNPGNFSTLWGKVYVMSPETGLPVSTINDPSKYTSGWFGRALADLGDVDKDANQISDFAIGNPRHPINARRSGRVFVYAGNKLAPVDPTPHYMILPPSSPSDIFNFGEAITRIDDVNDDKISDLAIGAPGFFGKSNAVFIHSGKDGKPLYFIQESTMDGFGATLAYLGGGLLGIGAPSYTASATRSRVGYVAVYKLGKTSATKEWGKVHGFTGEMFGSDLAAAGDFDGDTVMDVAITAPGAKTGNTLTPAVMVWSGDKNKQNAPLGFYKLNLNRAPGRMRVANLGDTDGDGRADFAISDDTDAWVVSGKQTGMTLIKKITGPLGGDVVSGKDIYSIGTMSLVTGAPYATLGTKKGQVQIQPLAATRWHGTGCSSTVPQPAQLLSTSRPVIGQTFSFEVSNNYTTAGTVIMGLDLPPAANVPIGACISYLRMGPTTLTIATQSLVMGGKNKFSFPVLVGAVPAFQGFVVQGFIALNSGALETTNAQVLRAGTK